MAAVVAEHLLQPALSPGRHRISEYANGSPGALMTAGFAAWALALAITARLTWTGGLAPRAARVLLGAVLSVAALGALLTALFDTGTSAGVVPAGHMLTVANHLHDYGSGALALALWGGGVVSLALAERRLRAWTAFVLASAVACAVALSLADLPGIEQRALVSLGCVWQFALLAALVPPASARAGG
ncbi:MAG: DUF998 domain-containing protein [Solirubrobacteraceae bacterium]